MTIVLAVITISLPIARTDVFTHTPTIMEQPTVVSQPASGSQSGIYFDHLLFIIMENAGISDICGSTLPPPCNGSNTPYMSSLANSYGIETQYVDLAGSSQPNYIGIMAATLNGCTSGCGANSLTEVNLVDRFEAAGLAWKAYMENQTPTAGCDNSDHGFYEFIHNPFVSFHDIDTNATRCNKIALANPANNSTCTGTDCALINDLNSGSAPNFMWLTPNDCNSMHGPISGSCSNGCVSSYTAACNKAGDSYLSGLVPNILNSNTFKNTRAALFITFDEGSGFCPSPNPSGADCMYTVWAGPTTKTNFSSNHADAHYFFTKTIETNWGLATMTGNDAGATAMTEFFTAPSPDFSISASSPAPTNAGQSGASTITVTALNGFSGIVSLTDTIPSGLTCGSISPNSITGSGTATVSCSATNAGNYTLTITGTGGSLVHTATALFQFRDFTVAASSVTVNSGISGTSTITVAAINRFAGTVTLTDNVPSGLVCGSITPGSVTGSGTATVSCSAAISGNYTLTITGTSGSLVHTATPIFHVQDFGIAASSPAPVNAGSSAISTITISALNHFGGVVSLTDTVASGLACGTVTPSSLTGSGTATVSCSATLAGNYTLTLTGTSGSLVHTAIALFQYRDFAIAVSSPGPANAGSSAITTVTVTSVNHFGGIVSLTDTVPSGLTCGNITPSSVTGSGSATISCSSTAAGNYTLTVTGTSGSLVHSATALFQFRDFTTSATTPGPVDSTQSATSTITIAALNHFDGLVNLTDTVPVGLTCGSITPTSVAGSGTATLSCSASVAGNYTLTITGSSGSLLHSPTVVLRFQDFTITATSPAAVDVGQSSTSTVTVVAVNGFAGTVAFSITTPVGLACGSFSPTSIISSGSATVSCSVTAAGNYTATITGTSTPLIHNATATFQFRDFTIAAASPAPVNAGNSATSTITVAALNHFAGSVSLSDTVPSGLTCGTILPNSVAGSGIATVSCNATVAGNYTLTVTGTNGALSHSVTVVISVQDYAITANGANVEINVGSNGSSSITVTPLNHFSGTVSLSVFGTTGIASSINPTSVPGGSGTATLTFSASTFGNYTVTIGSSSGTLTHTTTVNVQIVDFAIVANPSITILAGATGNSTLTVSAINGFSGIVNLQLTPSIGLTATAVPASIQGSGPSTMYVSGSTSGDYSITIKATSGSLSHTISVAIHVLDYSLVGDPVTLVATVGSSTSSSLTLQSLNHYAGNLSLTYSVQPDSSVTSAGGAGGGHPGLRMAPPGPILPIISINPQSFSLASDGTQLSTVGISLPSNLPAGRYLITVMASDGTLSHQIVITLSATDFNITATPNSAILQSGSNTTIVLNLKSLNFFQGNVSLTVTSPVGGPNGTLSTSTVQLTFFGNMNLNLTIQAPANTALGNYTITVQAKSGTVSHILNIPVTVTATGFVTILAEILSPQNSAPISIMAIFTLLTTFATLKIRSHQKRDTSLYSGRKIKNHNHQRSRTAQYLPYLSSLPLLWGPAPRDEF